MSASAYLNRPEQAEIFVEDIEKLSKESSKLKERLQHLDEEFFDLLKLINNDIQCKKDALSEFENKKSEKIGG